MIMIIRNHFTISPIIFDFFFLLNKDKKNLQQSADIPVIVLCPFFYLISLYHTFPVPTVYFIFAYGSKILILSFISMLTINSIQQTVDNKFNSANCINTITLQSGTYHSYSFSNLRFIANC